MKPGRQQVEENTEAIEINSAMIHHLVRRVESLEKQCNTLGLIVDGLAEIAKHQAAFMKTHNAVGTNVDQT